MEKTALITLIGTLLLVPVINIIVGIISKKNPPKEINRIRGYRTSLSMASQEAWDYANMRMSELMIKIGLCSLIVSVILGAILFFIKMNIDVVSIIVVIVVIVQALVLMLPIRTIEKELREEVYKK